MSDRPIAIVDLDGVVADVRHRLHHLEGRPKHWSAFFAGIPDDPPLAEGVGVARDLAQRCELVYLTGRPEHTRRATLDWLQRHDLPPGRLVMRRAGDRRPARVTKPALVKRLAGSRRVEVVVDDDPAVCEALERDGWTVLRAAWMTHSPALDAAQEELGRT